MSEKIYVSYMGGVSRANNADCDYMIAGVKGPDGDEVEIYAEVEYPDDIPCQSEVTKGEWEKYEKPVYIELYEDFMRQAKELGYKESDFIIDGGYDIKELRKEEELR